LVGLGEATHGTSEVFSLKDRIYRMLVERMGFTVFAMEMPWLSGRAIDTYVTTGQGNARAILAGSFAVWNNQEVLDLIEWMRAYDAAPGSHARLRFVGIDIEDNPSALARLIPPADARRV
jgi:erythromycin esterase